MKKTFNRNHKLSPKDRLSLLYEVYKKGQSVSLVCKQMGISRKTFYKWKNRWEKSGKKYDSLFNNKKYSKKIPFRVNPNIEKTILSLTAKYPNLSKYKITEKLHGIFGPIVGVHGVYNVLQRNRLTLPQQRLSYAQANGIDISSFITPTERMKVVFEEVAPIAIPITEPKISKQIPFWSIIKSFVIAFGLIFVSSLSLFYWLRIIAGGSPVLGSATQELSIGLVFAALALIMGSIFFLYSLKYYFTLAIVLSFSKQSFGQETTENGKARTGNKAPVGLEPNLEGITISKMPFVSVHIPFYNEKKVVERSIAAATNFDYPEYEIILADDSTDDTTAIIQSYIKNNCVALR